MTNSEHTKHIRAEYTHVITDFAEKLAEIDDKYGTYVRCDIDDFAIEEVGKHGPTYHRRIRLREVVI